MCGRESGTGAEFFGWAEEVAASGDSWVSFVVESDGVGGIVWDVGVVADVGAEGPFASISVHVVESPGIGFFRGNGMIGVSVIVGVVDKPGVFANLVWVVSEGIGGSGASAAGVFPFCFGGESVVVSGLCGEPFTEFGGGVLGHGDGGEVVLVSGVLGHAIVHGKVGRSGLGDGIDEFGIGEEGVFVGFLFSVVVE